MMTGEREKGSTSDAPSLSSCRARASVKVHSHACWLKTGRGVGGEEDRYRGTNRSVSNCVETRRKSTNGGRIKHGSLPASPSPKVSPLQKLMEGLSHTATTPTTYRVLVSETGRIERHMVLGSKGRRNPAWIIYHRYKQSRLALRRAT